MSDTEHVVEILTNEDGSPVTWEQFKAQYAADVEPVEVEEIGAVRAARLLISAGLADIENAETVMGNMVRHGVTADLPELRGQARTLAYLGDDVWAYTRTGSADYSGVDADPGTGHSASGFAANH